MVYAIGLTGGIGCGKSTAAQLFAELGATVIDTDGIAHRLTAPGQRALEVIAKKFGPEFILPDGQFDRARMRKLIFSNQEAKIGLESILHPLIKQEVISALAKCSTPYALIMAPLLFESGNYQDLIQRTLVVDCEPEQQIARVVARSNLSTPEIHAIMAAQISRKDRLARADDVLSNTGDLGNLRHQVEVLHHVYLTLAKEY